MEACEQMEDCTATIPNGIQKRPPLKLVGLMVGGFTISPGTLWQEIPRGSLAADVTLLINNEAGTIMPRLFQTATGAPIALNITTAARAYLQLNNPTVPNQQFRVCSIEDFNFISNRTVQVALGTDTTGTRNPEALLWCKVGQYGRTYSITIQATGGTAYTAAFTTPSGATSADALWVDTGVIINELYKWGGNPTTATGAPGNGLPTADGSAFSGVTLDTIPGFNFTVLGSVLYIQSTTGLDFTVTTADGSGSTAMYAIKTSVQSFDMLPLIGYPGFVLEVEQGAAGGNSDFYVQYSSNNSQPAGGVWTECLAPGSPLGVNPLTLPIAITVNETTGVWTCDVVAWSRRTVGNLALSPDPGFVGDYITDVKWWRGRLALISNGGVNLSASNSPFQFYSTTLAADLDSDPIGLLTPADRKTFFRQAITFDQRFFIMADRVQAAVSSGGSPVTPSTTSITVMAQSAFSDLSPVQLGNHKVRYLANRSSSSIVYLLAIDRLSGLALEEDRSTAIPQYLPATLDCATTWEADYITCWGTTGGSQIYVAVYREEQYQEVQNAYYRWNLPTGYTLGGMYFKLGVLYLLIGSPTGNPLFCTLDVTQNQITQGRDGQVSTIAQYLDFMVDDTLCTSALVAASSIHMPSNTAVTIPANLTGTVGVSLRQAFNGYPEGFLIPIISQVGQVVTLQGGWIGAPLWIGLYTSSFFIPTEWWAVGADKKPQHDGRYSLKRLRVDISQYGYFRAEVTVKGRATRLYPYQGYYQDDPYTPIDSPPQEETAVLNVPLAGNSRHTKVKFVSDTHLGFKLLGYEVRGDWNPRSRRTT
jgi:hypothetical protein